MTKSDLLIHACCAPCLTAPLNLFRDEKRTPSVFFFNPNIHPYTEYLKRRDCLIEFCEQEQVKLLVKEEYSLEEFLRGVIFREHERCRDCYYTRLKAAAQYARRGDFSHFTTTLLISPYQKHDLIREIGLELASEYKVEFLYRDLRVLWPERTRLTREYNLYRQRYCGCIYSEKERYLKKNKGQ